MALLFPTPDWFYMYETILEILFALVTLFVSYLTFRIYKKTYQRYVLFFGIGTIMISISYFIQTILNFVILYKLGSDEALVMKILSAQALNTIGLLTHTFFFIMGLVFLLFITFKEKRLRLLWLLILISISIIFGSQNVLYMFYLISSIYLFFISWHYLSNYWKKKNSSQMLVALAFIFLFLGHCHFLISVNLEFLYVVGKILELLAYCFIVGNLYMVYRK
ncbi:MAG: hypothetical protein ACQESF_06105 [Nanobdellota archaeon]